MGMNKCKTLYRSFDKMALVFLCLLTPSKTYCQSHPASPTAQKWADPGALEKAQTQAAMQNQNKNTPPAATSSTSTGAATQPVSVSAPKKAAISARSSSISRGEPMSKVDHQRSEQTVIHRTSHRDVKAHSTLPEASYASGPEQKLTFAPGHALATKKAQTLSAIKAAARSARTKDRHIVHDSLPSKKDAPSSSVTAEFDPIYGYSNLISVAY
jgi:hypothetical protein